MWLCICARQTVIEMIPQMVIDFKQQWSNPVDRIWQTHEEVFDYQKRFGIITGFRLLEPEGNLNKLRETFELFNSYSKYLSVCYQRKQLYCAFSSLYNTTGVNTNEINIVWNKLEWYAERDVVDVERINKVKYVLNETAKLPCKLQTVTIK